MLFNSWPFFFFFLVCLPVYYCLNRRAQNVWLLLGSYFFYGWWDPRFLGLILLSTIVDYFCGLGLAGKNSEKKRKAFLFLSLVTNLGILGFFKYFDFFIASFAQLLETLGMQANLPTLHIILPVGISFYTFQTLSYSIDIYQRKLEPRRNFLDFSLFVSFYPQLVAGPIERARHLLPQIEQKRVVTTKLFADGAHLILLGLFKKVAIADTIAGQVALAFRDPASASSTILLGGIYLFAIQIYCDFSGYSDIARGLSKLHGFDLMENFNQPYFSRNITEFWRRWHISLSTWLRDYLYIPLGGNRKGHCRTYINLMVTMLLGGLWHGASWRFVVWGALHGIFLAAHKIIVGEKAKEESSWSNPKNWTMSILGILITFHLVLVTWVFFRANSFSDATTFLLGIFKNWENAAWVDLRLPLLAVIVMISIDIPCYVKKSHTAIMSWPLPIRVVVYTLMVLAIIMLGSAEEVPFVYFQF